MPFAGNIMLLHKWAHRRSVFKELCMAEDHIGQRTETKAPWTKIFTAFKVALDPKKLLLAAAGILAMAAGWWLLAAAFYAPRALPQWGDYWSDIKEEKAKEEID